MYLLPSLPARTGLALGISKLSANKKTFSRISVGSLSSDDIARFDFSRFMLRCLRGLDGVDDRDEFVEDVVEEVLGLNGRPIHFGAF